MLNVVVLVPNGMRYAVRMIEIEMNGKNYAQFQDIIASFRNAAC